jgi:hypothetical protein
MDKTINSFSFHKFEIIILHDLLGYPRTRNKIIHIVGYNNYDWFSTPWRQIFKK